MKNKFLVILILILSLTACKDEILEIQNPSGFNEETYFKTKDQMNAAIYGAYGVLLDQGFWARDWHFIFDLMSGEAARNTFLLGEDAQLYDFSFNNTYKYNNFLWYGLYRMRTRACIAHEKAIAWQASTTEEKDLKIWIQGEALFLKSFAYFNLVRLYGEVPYLSTWTEIKDPANLNQPRQELSYIFPKIEADLLEAITLLPSAWADASKGRVTLWSAKALLAKVYMEQGKFNEALTQLLDIYNSTIFKLWDWDKQFSEENSKSPETLFDVRHSTWTDWSLGNAFYMFGNNGTWGGTAAHTGRAMEYGFNDWWNVTVSNGATKSFRYNVDGVSYLDPRATLTFYGDPEIGGKTTWKGGNYDFRVKKNSWRKYERYDTQLNEGLPASPINSQIIRYSDVLLMIAECYFYTDKFSEGLTFINAVRSRPGLDIKKYTQVPASFDEAFKILNTERRVEFAGEQQRWFDLRRWQLQSKKANGFSMFGEINSYRTLDDVNKPQLITGELEKYMYFPIPQSELDNNPRIKGDNSRHYQNWN